jgi:hypothetical protein
MSYARRVDDNHAEIVATLRALGWDVLDTSRLPGFVDLVAWHYGRQRLRLIEVKRRSGRFSAAQRRLQERKWPIVTIRTRDEAVSL